MTPREQQMVAIGDRLWLAQYQENSRKTVPCCVCFGKLRVTLILGNGESVELPCDYCGKGFDGPTGTEVVYELECSAEPFVVARVETSTTEEGAERRYMSTAHHSNDGARLFATEAEAIACAEALVAKALEEKRTRTEHIKSDAKKSFSWNAGYHMRQAKDHERQAAYHRERVALCEGRAKVETASERK